MQQVFLKRFVLADHPVADFVRAEGTPAALVFRGDQRMRLVNVDDEDLARLTHAVAEGKRRCPPPCLRPCRVAVDPAWLRWRDGAIVHMAQAIDDERRFQDLPILADALEEAGCTDPEILGHCRGAAEHVRGCWVVDLLLGKP